MISKEKINQLNTLRDDIYDNAVKHGWWNKPRNTGDMLCLLHSEVSEAWDCAKSGQIQTVIRDLGKPEGYFTEIADVVIRVLDMMGGAGIEVCAIDEKHLENYTDAEFLCEINLAISTALENVRNVKVDRYAEDLSRIIDKCFKIESDADCDLIFEIKRKHAFNKTRPYRHGNKVL